MLAHERDAGAWIRGDSDFVVSADGTPVAGICHAR